MANSSFAFLEISRIFSQVFLTHSWLNPHLEDLGDLEGQLQQHLHSI